MDTNSNSQLIKKIMKKLTIIFTIILSVFSKNVMAQGEHPSNKQSEHPSNKTASNTIVDVAVSNKDFSTLV